MNRSEMVEKAIDILVTTYGSEATEGDQAAAQRIIASILPQVTTVAELEALAAGTIVVSHNGYPFERGFNNEMSVGGEPAGTTLTVIRQFAPLTVVWTPEATS